MNNKHLFLTTVAFSLAASNAFGACSQIPLHILDASSNNVAMSSGTAADGSCLTNIGVASGGIQSGAVSAGAFAAGALAAGAFASGSFASGSIAAGAIAAGAISSGAALASAFLDGSIVTLGTTGDVAWVSGAGTIVALQKAIISSVNAPIPAGTNLIGTVTAVVSGLPLVQLTTGTATIGLVQATTGTAVMGFVSNDPCAQKVKSNFAFGQGATTFLMVAGVSAQKVYVCSIVAVGAAAFTASLIEGTGATCVTGSELAVIGSTTAASGLGFATNNGWAQGNGGGTIAPMTNASSNLCFLQVSPVTVAGNITFVQQ